MVALMVFYLSHLPHNILKALITDIHSERRLWINDPRVDSRELSIVFKFLDQDQSGTVSCREILKAFKDHGLGISDEELEQVGIYISEHCGADVTRENFESRFGDIFGVNLVRFRRGMSMRGGANGYVQVDPDTLGKASL